MESDIGSPSSSETPSEALKSLSQKTQDIQGLADRIIDKLNADSASGPTDVEAVERARRLLEQLTSKLALGEIGKDPREHKFWATQYVPQPGDGTLLGNSYIVPQVPLHQEPYTLPNDLVWTAVDISDPDQLEEVYDLLLFNYVETGGGAFRLRYSPEMLSWALKPPGYYKEWQLGIRASSTKELMGFISGVPLTLRVRSSRFLACEINFLCIHKSLRSQSMAPTLIKEITRRVALKGIFQAVYTSVALIPTPVSVCRYYYRPLNIPKLVDINFCQVSRDMTLSSMTEANKVAEATSLSGLREMESSDIPQVADLFRRYQGRFDLTPEYSVEEIEHQLLGGRGNGSVGQCGLGRRIGQVTWAYVIENPETKKITDFFSFYSLSSTVIRSTKYPICEAACLFYYASETAFVEGTEADGQLRKRLAALIGDAVVVAHAAGFDVLSAWTLMDNVLLFQDLKFQAGNGFLNYYLYNWKTTLLSGMKAQEGVPAGKGIGLVML